MLKVKIEKSFKKDIERDKRSGKYSRADFDILKSIITSLQNEEIIDQKYKRHYLKGDLKEYESIHVKKDWLLILKIDGELLKLTMLGKHTQVYKKFS